MPELPEVETTIRQLKTKVLNRTFVDFWTDTPKIIKKPKNINDFKKQIIGKKILNLRHKGKNIIFDLSESKSLLIHQKLTGHLLFGEWKLLNNKWVPVKKNALAEKINSYIHLLFVFDNNKMMALSDLRKFAKVELWDKDKLENSDVFKKIGIDPMDKNFTFKKFKEILKNKKGPIKKILMNQEIIAGIGNIYSDEILWDSKIHPLTKISSLEDKELKKIYLSIKKILKRAIKLKGESFSDYRLPSGEKGDFDKERKVYRRENQQCFRCKNSIKRVKINNRSAYFCPFCQKNNL
ncbi:MAG TPA: DNA-formamidopyrimidine glycosylase [Candidatus Pacearchaeota archaeon]|nr:DNA-formamidopyrimidine glycosylase [Candidatus Pacearchaeota archaeon]